MVSLRFALLIVCSAGFAVPFIIVSVSQFSRYFAHELDVNIANVPEYDDLRFPAFSICSNYFNFSAFASAVKAPFASTSLPIRAETGNLYNTLDRFNLLANLTSYMWQNYFTLNKMLHPELGCSIGGASCVYPYGVAWPQKDNAALKVDVAAGRWTSRFLSDGQDGFNTLCHTLVTNRSVNFHVRNGNALILKWNTAFSGSVTQWQIYVHDAGEAVVLGTYAINSLSYLPLKRGSDTTEANYKKKARLLPQVNVKAGTSNHPCNDSAGYSANQCDVDFCWNRRAQAMRDFYSDRFNCVLPGVVASVNGSTNATAYPVCKIATQVATNSSLGLLDLITNEQNKVLISPPIGVELMGGSGCLRRCKSFTYDLHVEDVDMEADPVLKTSDVHIYFPSAFAQVWTEYEMYTVVSLLSEVGGSLGLFLGLSLLSVVEVACKIGELVAFCAKKAVATKNKKNTAEVIESAQGDKK